MKINKGNKKITINGIQTSSIIEFEFSDYILYVFPGALSKFDILIKYKKGNKKIRTPKHVHWAVDILLKMQMNNELTRDFLKEIKNIWELCTPLNNRDFDTLKNLIEKDIQQLNIKNYMELNDYGEYQIDFLYVLMKLLSIQEKTNRNDAYMFGQIIDELLEIDLDIFKIISTAGFSGRR